ncbi:nitrilotriacetate monooxygenase component b [Colletotrichum truncatum]|uniref:Nitrilotriacetate monooxygenase component b n=1 Tax=Colletotrichum truncatum TaxID=5467 RepID=A0ACC3YJJ7_COLTU|nr:nitrilotriacetate monooxygenase component b [Colletotrichum truncatum]KAF6797331.1 nitrilotriacetate monooxygenase component b [Colletotrichum truncatum]
MPSNNRSRNLLRLLSTIPSRAPPSHPSPARFFFPNSPLKTFNTRRTYSKMAQQNTNFAGGASAQHNPHPDFKSVEASRPPFDTSLNVNWTKTVDPEWKYGSGANALGKSSASHVAIDPHEEGRPAGFNYKLLISGIVPRPIAFVSTRSADGTVTNLAPFSYFNMVNHDPPLFVVGFAASVEKPKDSLKNLLESKECVINIISEGFLEAANATSVNAPYGKSEWDVSGLTPVYDCKHVKAARVKEAIFSVEGTLDSFKEYDSKATPGKKSGVVCIIEGRNFWVREDAINEQKNIVDPAVLRPISRLGGITYGRVTEVLEIPRADWEANIGGEEGYEKIKKSEQ